MKLTTIKLFLATVFLIFSGSAFAAACDLSGSTYYGPGQSCSYTGSNSSGGSVTATIANDSSHNYFNLKGTQTAASIYVYINYLNGVNNPTSCSNGESVNAYNIEIPPTVSGAPSQTQIYLSQITSNSGSSSSIQFMLEFSDPCNDGQL